MKITEVKELVRTTKETTVKELKVLVDKTVEARVGNATADMSKELHVVREHIRERITDVTKYVDQKILSTNEKYDKEVESLLGKIELSETRIKELEERDQSKENAKMI